MCSTIFLIPNNEILIIINHFCTIYNHEWFQSWLFFSQFLCLRSLVDSVKLAMIQLCIVREISHGFLLSKAKNVRLDVSFNLIYCL